MQPDIEIYLKDANKEQVHEWLQSLFSQCTEWKSKGATYQCTCDGIPFIWYQKAVGSWHSLFIDSPNSPWADDTTCAQAAHSALNVEVRCAPGSWNESDGEEDADRWIKVSAQGVEEFIWRV